MVVHGTEWKWLELNKETERLVNQVEKELQTLRVKIEHRENPKLLKAYQKLLSTLDEHARAPCTFSKDKKHGK